MRRRFGKRSVQVYKRGAGRAAALVTGDGSTLDVVAVLGMRWLLVKVV